MALQLEGFEERAALLLTHVTRKFEIELKYEHDTSKAKLEAKDELLSLLQRELDMATAWYRSPVFITLVATAATIVGMFVIGYTWSFFANGVSP